VAPEPEDVADVDEAFNNFDAISYAKGNSAIQQLVTWLGDEDFLAGVNAYFARHRFGNATLADFVDALDGATDRDVRGWVEAWLRTTGFDTIRVTRDDDGVVLTREGSRPHRFSVTTYGADLVATGTTMVDLADDPVLLPGAAVIVPNAGNETFARLRLDPESWSALSHDLASVAEDSTRAVAWATAIDLVRCGDLAPEDFLGLVTRHAPRERSVAIIEAVLGWTRRTLVAHHLSPAAVPDAVAQVAAACETGLAAGPEEPIAVALTHTLAATSPDSLLLGKWLVDRQTHTGLPVEPDLRWTAIRRLASLGALTTGEIDDERVGDGTIVGVLGAAGANAALPTPEAKAVAWERLLGDDGLSNREFEAVSYGFWSPEQTGLVHDYLPRYLHEGLAAAQRRGPSFEERLGKSFPMVPFADEHVAALEEVLCGDVPTVLRRAWEDAYDDLTRTR
jgi:aminopeptidase N